MVSRSTLRFASLDEVASLVERLHRAGYQQTGNWSLSQVCEHLADWMTYPMDGFPKMPFMIRILLGVMRTVRGKANLKKIIETQSMPANQPTAPETVHGPGDDGVSVRRLLKVIDRLKSHCGTIHPSPLFGALSREELIALQLAHCSHHLSFLVPK